MWQNGTHQAGVFHDLLSDGRIKTLGDESARGLVLHGGRICTGRQTHCAVEDRLDRAAFWQLPAKTLQPCRQAVAKTAKE